MKTRLFLKAILIGTLGFSWHISKSQAADEAGKTVKILTVGNSFSQNATKYLGDLVATTKNKLVHGSIVVGGASLELHATKAQKHAEDPASPEGRYANERSLVQYLKEQKWDYVTIQQASIKSHDYATYQPFGDQLTKVIRENAPQAQLLVHQTWAYRVDDPRFKPKDSIKVQLGEPATQKEMYEGLQNAYHQLAKAVNAKILPVGEAFWMADQDPKFGFKSIGEFDFANAKKPAVPEQKNSLHVGWRWAKDRKEPKVIRLSMDGHHANVAGEYLGTCVWYEFLFQEDVRPLTYYPEGVAPEHAAFLREVAHRVVLGKPAN